MKTLGFLIDFNDFALNKIRVMTVIITRTVRLKFRTESSKDGATQHSASYSIPF